MTSDSEGIQMRLFTAINFDIETKQKLLDIQASLKSQAASANYTRAENLHLTLAFLGEVDARRLPDVKRALASLSAKPVTLVFSGSGNFGGGLYYVDIKPAPELMALQSQLAGRLRGEGFALENRSYRPHVTLARRLKPDAQIETGFEPFAMKAERVSLMESETSGGKLGYTEIFSNRLE